MREIVDPEVMWLVGCFIAFRNELHINIKVLLVPRQNAATCHRTDRQVNIEWDCNCCENDTDFKVGVVYRPVLLYFIQICALMTFLYL